MSGKVRLNGTRVSGYSNTKIRFTFVKLSIAGRLSMIMCLPSPMGTAAPDLVAVDEKKESR